jgi:NADPH:quinone reductase
MRAVRVHSLTGPAGLVLDDIPAPNADALGPTDVLVEVRAAGVNFPDVLLSRGKYQFKPEPPFIPGGEASGVVRAVGAKVSTLAVGDRVAATMIHGAFAEQIVVPEIATVKLPDRVSFEAGAATLLTYATTLHALEDRARLGTRRDRRETLLVLGAAGGVGLAAVHLGKLLGARVIAAASSDEKIATCLEAGAEAGIVYGREDLKERVKALTNGDGADVVYDPVGGPYTEPALRAIAWEGRYLVVGFAAGEIPKIPLNLVLLKGCDVVGVFWGSFAAREPAKNRGHAERLLGWVADGSLSPRIDETFSFDRAGEALAHLEDRKVRGKVILTS